MNKLLLITLFYFFLTSCKNVENFENVENKKKKNLNKEFTISIMSNVKVNK